MRQKILPYFLLIGTVIAISILLYPTFMDSFNNITQISVIASYENDLDSIDADEIDRLKKEAAAYNQSIYEEQQMQSFSYRGEDATDPEYEKTLSAKDGAGTMCFLEIPKLKLYLPVMHGTKTKELENSVGHMYGTSVPSGNSSANAVLAAHTGLQKADLFTDLTRMEEGDQFFIHVLNEIHVYTVDQITVVYPAEEDPYLQAVEGEDYITLYTCTPYGINDHRLLVRGKRTMPDIVQEAEEGRTETTTRNRMAIIRTVLLGIIPVLLLIAGILLIRKKQRTVHIDEAR